MRNLKNKIILHCQLGCGREVGTAHTLTPVTEDEYRTKTGIVDQRCSQCETDYGTFRELLYAYEKETRDSPAQAEAFVIKHRKRDQFRTALNNEITKREKKQKRKIMI